MQYLTTLNMETHIIVLTGKGANRNILISSPLNGLMMMFTQGRHRRTNHALHLGLNAYIDYVPIIGNARNLTSIYENVLYKLLRQMASDSFLICVLIWRQVSSFEARVSSCAIATLG